MKPTKLINEIIKAFGYLYTYGDEVQQKTWQSTEVKDPFLEIDNVFLRAQISEGQGQLIVDTQADLPWSEDHFQERISGINLNPGKQWENWPYYRKDKDDELFRHRGEGLFSHTYQERFWPSSYEATFIKNKKYHNIIPLTRFDVGDYDDIIQRAKYDNTSRQLYLSIWHPEDQSNDDFTTGKMTRRLPCSLGYYFLIRDGKVNLSYFIRSCDILRHFKNDIYMACRLAQDFRDKVDNKLQMGMFNMWVGSLHCWAKEKELLKKYFIK